jgi:DNA mismatch repair protein MutS2
MREFLDSFSKLEFDKIKKHIQRYASSDLGKERLEHLAPSSDIAEVRASLALVSEMKRLLESHEAPPLEELPDVRVALQRSSIENYALAPADLHRVALTLATSRKIHSYITRRKSNFPLLWQLLSPIYLHNILEFNINRAIDDQGLVKDSATKELGAIRKQMFEKTESLRKRLESILRGVAEKDWAQEEIITTRDARMVIPVKTEHKNKVPGFIHSASGSGATVFIEPTETLELNNDLRTLQFREQREIEKILRELTDQVRGVREELLANSRLLAELDFIIAKAKYSLEAIGSEPILKEGGRIRLLDARHPLLILRHKRDDVVPLNVDLGPEIRTVVISGPNAGGKSVAMKTIGILALLAQSGCHIPATSGTELPLFTEIFVDMGDEQSIENDLSSFSSHLNNLKQLLENVTETSLVLIDEIGSGTDPQEGAAIASAVLEQLTQSGCKTIATTHHGALKTFAFETEGVENAAMEFDMASLQPTYRFKIGLPGSSYAMEMAERISFPKSAVDRAKEIRGTKAYDLERLIDDLQNKSAALASDLERIQVEKHDLNVLTRSYEEKNATLQKSLREIKLQAAKDAEEIVARANAAIEGAVREIKESSGEKEAVKAARQRIDSLKEDVRRLHSEVQVEEAVRQNFTPGDPVRLKESQASGEILQQIDDDNFIVLIGSLRVKVKRGELLSAPRKQKLGSIPMSQGPSEPAKNELDLRGMYGDEAIIAVEKIFDDAILNNLHKINIIHGKGTGALRKRITEFLKSHPSVKSYRLGEWNEGGTGVTVVELS